MQKLIKRSAIHNIIINECSDIIMEGEINEGLVIPRKILEAADIKNGEQIIVTKIYGDNWINRIKTFVIEGEREGFVEARGSLARFYEKGEMACIVTFTLFDEGQFDDYLEDRYPIFDIGFNPETNQDNLEFNLNIEFRSYKEFNVSDYGKYSEYRKNYTRFRLSTLIQNLEVNKTHPDCLQGSAELPGNVMQAVGLSRYEGVCVYNASRGGASETYAVPMPDKVVMTTGAMAKFAKVGELVNIASFAVSKEEVIPKIIYSKNNGL